MQRRRVVLDLSPSRLELALVAGRDSVIAARVHALPADLLEDYPASLDAVRPVIQEWAQRLELRGLPTTLLYTSPDAHAGIISVPAAVSRRAASQAGQLALADAVSFPLDLNPHTITPLGPAADGQLRLLGIADTEASVSAVFDAVAEAGLRVEAVVPAAAALIVSTVRTASTLAQDPAGAGAMLLLHIGEHGSVLAAVAGGRLRFIRNFAVGVNSFVDALCRPITPREGGRAPIHLDRADAREILFAAGVPRREDTVDAGRGIDGAALLPLLQPVLQRCAVEIKQSLRFGLDETERASVSLRLLGHGRSMPRLGESIVEIHGAPLSFAPAPSPAPGEAPLGGATAAFLDAGPIRAGLLPRPIHADRTARSVARALWLGVGAAGLLIAGEGALTHLSLRAESARAGATTAAAEQDRAAFLAYDRAVAARSAVAAARVRMTAALGGSADWSALLQTLAGLTPTDIRLRSIDLTDEPGEGPRCRLRAAAAPPEGTPPAVAIKRYLDALQDVPLVSGVRLGASGRAVVDGADVHEFELFCDLVPLPGAAPIASATPAEPGP